MDLIIGAGNIGATAADLYHAGGSHLRLGVRTIEKARKSLPGITAEFVPFDFERSETFDQVMEGVNTILFIAPHANPTVSIQPFLQAAERASVNKLIFSSGRTTGDIPGKPLYEVEQMIRSQSIPFTILRPGWFMQNFTSWIGATIANEGAFYLPVGHAGTAFIDVRDIADVAWKVSQSDEWNGQTLPLTSDEVLNHHQIAEKISQVIGREIRFIPLAAEAYCDKMTSLGWPLSAAKHIVELYEMVQSGKEEEISSSVNQVLGRAPYNFDTFLRHHPQKLAEIAGVIS